MLILIRGLPGSGKSTMAKKMIGIMGSIACHLEADMFFVMDGIYVFDHNKVKEAHAWCQDKTREALASGKTCIVSNTFVKKWEMEPYIKMASDLNEEMIVIEAKGNYGNIHNLPLEVIERMRDTWEEYP
jgi:predicted kinase